MKEIGGILSYRTEGISHPAQAMPEDMRIIGDPVQAYRNYYNHAKSWATWTKGTKAPEWWERQ